MGSTSTTGDIFDRIQQQLDAARRECPDHARAALERAWCEFAELIDGARTAFDRAPDPGVQLALELADTRHRLSDAQAVAAEQRQIRLSLERTLDEEREEHRRTMLELQNMRRALRLTEARLGTALDLHARRAPRPRRTASRSL